MLHPHPKETYTIHLKQRDAGGRRVYVRAEQRGSKVRFITHACNPNTEYVEVRSRRRIIVSIVSKRSIKTGEDISADYTR